nr:tetratricopeptide repeat protein [Ktedonobacteraceae bacterium]
ETLLDILAQPAAASLATFISRLTEGEGTILLTSRVLPPASWKIAAVIKVDGLEEQAGADLFRDLLPSDHKPLATSSERVRLSHRVGGHPLSIRLLAGRFSEGSADLAMFMENIEAELAAAEQDTPTSLEDPGRQRTLYACMDYSVKRLSPEQRTVLNAISLFHSAFIPEFAAYLLDDEEQTPRHLQTLVRLGLLNREVKIFQEGDLRLFELHPMVRWYVQQKPPEHPAALLERYGEVYQAFVRQAYDEYDRSPSVRYLLRQSLADCDAALQYLPPAGQSILAYHLAARYQQLGQNRRARELYEHSLEIDQELGNIRGVAVTQNAMADVLRQQGKPQEAMKLYEHSLEIAQELGDIRGVAVTQNAMAAVLNQQGKPQEAMKLYEEALRTKQELGDIRGVAVTQNAMAVVLSQQGQPQEAMKLYEQSLEIAQELGDIREAAVTQANFSQLLLQQGEQQRALQMAWQAYSSLLQRGYTHDAQIMQQLLISFKGEILGPAQFDAVWREAIDVPQPEWLRNVKRSGNALEISEETVQAVEDFLTAEDWNATQEVVQTQHELLFRPEVETLFEQNIMQARNAGEERALQLLEIHLALLRACKDVGIQQAFEQLFAAQEDALPFDAELISGSIAALLGSPQERLEYMQSLTEQASRTQDEELKALIRVIQLALFSKEDLSHLGRDLQGVYRQAWETIAASVEAGGMDAEDFEAIASNTLAVLGPAANQRNEWRTSLAELRNGATVQGRGNLAALLDAVIRLLDADSNPAGLGGGLKGIYAQTWQVIVEGLPK